MMDELNKYINLYNIPHECRTMSYGTTGYRMLSEYLYGITFRMSLLAAMRSLSIGKTVGLMITASHNEEKDNGVKLIDHNGEMIDKEWESVAVELVKWNENEFLNLFLSKCKLLGISLSQAVKGQVFIGYDTRISSPKLSEVACKALNCIGINFFVFEHVTTPQLHFFVKRYNEIHTTEVSSLLDEYFGRLSNAFCERKTIASPESRKLNIDCANGVGGIHLKRLAKLISNCETLLLYNVECQNLNDKCGADFVKINQNIPVIHNGGNDKLIPNERWCSIDGDADRLIYFYLDHKSKFCLLDGDKMASLIGAFIKQILKHEIETNLFSVAIIQTAYANSSSTEYIENVLNIRTKCVPTGVKHLHKAAKEYDIGIYFEANGHGTVLFSDKVREYSRSLEDGHELQRALSIVNEADGDALSDILLIEHILTSWNWNLEQWNDLYTDYPSRQLKVPVRDRSMIITTYDERQVVSPMTLQNAIDNLVVNEIHDEVKHARAFVRPSGTEDIVRIYSEASTQHAADELVTKISYLMKELFNK